MSNGLGSNPDHRLMAEILDNVKGDLIRSIILHRFLVVLTFAVSDPEGTYSNTTQTCIDFGKKCVRSYLNNTFKASGISGSFQNSLSR